jgi:hypothetical protein
MSPAHAITTGRILRSGALAGTATSIAFAALHQLLISDIWFSLLPMTVAGAICGLCLAWSYRLLFPRPSARTWLLYNLSFVPLFLLLGLVSFALYDPVYTIAGLIAGVEPAGQLLRQGMPLTFGFALAVALVAVLAVGRTARKATAITATSLALTVLLGHNAAVLGMVRMTSAALPMLAEFFGLIAMIMAGNAAAFLLFERRGLFATPAFEPPAASPQPELSP